MRSSAVREDSSHAAHEEATIQRMYASLEEKNASEDIQEK